MKGSGGEKAVTQKLWISDVSSGEKEFQVASFESSSGSRRWTHHPSHGLVPAWFAAVGMGCASRSWSEPNFCPGREMVHLTNSKSYPGCIHCNAAYGTRATPPPCSPVPGASGSPRGPWPRGCCSTRPGMLSALGLQPGAAAAGLVLMPHEAKSGTSPLRSVALPSLKTPVQEGRLSQTRCHFLQPLPAPACCGYGCLHLSQLLLCSSIHLSFSMRIQEVLL